MSRLRMASRWLAAFVLLVGSLAGATALLPKRARASNSVSVAAASGWVDTGVNVVAGTTLGITATGSWSPDGSNFAGPNGLTQTSPDNFLNLTDIGQCSTCATTQTGHAAALIGYIGAALPAPGSYVNTSILPQAQKVFLVGASLSKGISTNGELWLAMNDDAYSGYTPDNTGNVSAAISDSAQSIVSAAGGWTDTHVAVGAGDKLAVNAAGSWSPDGTNFATADGLTQTSSDNYLNVTDLGVCGFCATTQTGHYAALVGYIGSAPPAPGSYTSTSILPSAQKVFVVGSNYSATSPGTGDLWLAMNDDAYSGVTSDNSGSISAVVTDTNPAPAGEAVSQKVLLYVYDPSLTNIAGSPKLNAYYGWEDPLQRSQEIVNELTADSHNIVNYNIVSTQVINKFPIFQDGFQYTPPTWESDWANRTPHNAQFDYNRFINDNNIVSQINSGAYDEVWIYADPMAGMWESTMAGDGAYWLNSSPVPNVQSNKVFAIMGWNYERTDALAIHSYGHRVESIMNHMYGGTIGNWGKFATYDQQSPGNGNVGNVHFPVNGIQDYDYGNLNYVPSNADDWFNYPNFKGLSRQVNAYEWAPELASAPDTNDIFQRDYLNWWYRHFPHASGRASDKLLNDWWRYIINIDKYKFGDQLLGNSSFETVNSSNQPTAWSTSAKFTRSNAVAAEQGYYDGRFSATDNSSTTISQTVNNLSAGKSYTLSGWANIPTQKDGTFDLKFRVQWLNSSGVAISTATVKTYTAATGGWSQATKALTAPSGTTHASVKIVTDSLNGALYVDGMSLQ